MLSYGWYSKAYIPIQKYPPLNSLILKDHYVGPESIGNSLTFIVAEAPLLIKKCPQLLFSVSSTNSSLPFSQTH